MSYELREVKARKAAKKAAKGNVVAMKAKPMASKQKGGSVMWAAWFLEVVFLKQIAFLTQEGRKKLTLGRFIFLLKKEWTFNTEFSILSSEGVKV